MDPFSQAALGAVVARSVAPADMVKGVLFAGAVLGAAPDIDVLFSWPGDFFANLKHHRGLTHSLILLTLAGPLVGHWLWRRLGAGGRWRRQHLWWMAIATAALLSHPLLDWLTTYGTQLLLPLTERRFAINAMPIIDPLYTLMLVLGVVLAAHLPTPLLCKRAALTALALSLAYIGYGWRQNSVAEALAHAQLGDEGLTHYQLSAFPTVLQVHLRRLVVRTQDEVRVGYISTWSPCEVVWGTTPAADEAAGARLAATPEGRVFNWFAMGWSHPSVRRVPDGFAVTLSDLRYGATLDPTESFFSVAARFDRAWRPIGRPLGRWSRPDVQAADIGALYAAAYSGNCGRLALFAPPPASDAGLPSKPPTPQAQAGGRLQPDS